MRTFGSLELLRDNEPFAGAAAQRQRLALLAVVARYGARGIARDRVLDILWPGPRENGGGAPGASYDPEAARHSLDQALSALRGEPGGPRFVEGQATLRLNAGAISADVAEFDAATRDAPARAVELYAGPFLDGFRPRNSEEFERWVTAERAALARAYAGCLDALARRAAQAGEVAASARWLEKLATQGLSDDVAVRYLETLLALDDPARARQFVRYYETRLREEEATEPSQRFELLKRRIRERPAPPPPPAAAPAAPPPPPPRVLEYFQTLLGRARCTHYELRRVLEQGATLVRFAASDRRHNSAPVEVSILAPDVAAAIDRQTFTDVLGRVMALTHPGIAPVIDVAATADLLYYVTTPIQGESLTQRLRRERPIGVTAAVEIARDLAAALAAAHAVGVPHLDLRPKHITMTASGPVLARVGVAVAVTGGTTAGRSAQTDPRSALVMLGEPAYLSPEQLVGDTLPDGRSDVYALGGLLFELLAGEPPFGTGVLQPRRKLVQAAPPLRTVRAHASDALEAVVSRCLERIPADRYQSVGEPLSALNAILVADRRTQ